MSPYKAFLNNTRQYFNTNGFLRFLLSMYIGVFALGGVLFVLGAFLLTDILTTIGIVIMLAGLLLTLIKEDMMVLVITSGVIALLSFVAFIIPLFSRNYFGIVYGGYFYFTPFFYFLAFGTIAVFVFIKAEKFKQMRAASAARAQMAGIACPRCGAFVPMNAAFCPSCGAQNPAMQQYAAPVQPQYAPPIQPQYASPVPPVQAEAAAAPKCVNCGADIPAGAAFCAKCGAKQ